MSDIVAYKTAFINSSIIFSFWETKHNTFAFGQNSYQSKFKTNIFRNQRLTFHCLAESLAA